MSPPPTWCDDHSSIFIQILTHKFNLEANFIQLFQLHIITSELSKMNLISNLVNQVGKCILGFLKIIHGWFYILVACYWVLAGQSRLLLLYFQRPPANVILAKTFIKWQIKVKSNTSLTERHVTISEVMSTFFKHITSYTVHLDWICDLLLKSYCVHHLYQSAVQ